MAHPASNQTINASYNSGVITGQNNGTININQPDEEKDPISRLYLTDPDVDRVNLKALKGETVPNTCAWILEDSRYREWLDSGSSSLWLTAGPGKGKTMLVLHIIEALQKSEVTKANKTILYFFCSDRSGTQGDGIAVLRGLLYQFIKRHPHLEKYCKASLKMENHRQTLSSLGELMRIFSLMVEDPELGEIFCIIDAVEECEGTSQKELLKRLFALTGRRENGVSFKLLGASRTITGVHFKPDRLILLDDSSTPIMNDIETFIEDKIQLLSNLEDFEDHANRFRDKLREKHGGTFLWVGLMVQRLEKVDTVDEALELLEQAQCLATDWICLNDSKSRRAFPLLRYATKYWTSHARQNSGENVELADPSHPLLEESTEGSALRYRWELTYFLDSWHWDFVRTLSQKQSGLSTLHLAARVGLLSWIPKILARSNASTALVRTRDETKRDALMHAAQGNHEGVVKILLEHGAIPTQATYAAAMHVDNHAMLQMLIEHGRVNATFHEDFPGEESGCEELRAQGISITPLVEAIMQLKWDAALALVGAGARVHDFAWCLENVIAVLDPCSALIDRLMQHPQLKDEELYPVIEAVSRICNAEADFVAHFLLDRYLKIHGRSTIKSKLENILLIAASRGLIKTVRSLIKEKVNLKVRNEEGFSAPLLAMGFGHQDVADLLIKSGAKLGILTTILAKPGVHVPTTVGCLVLCLAASHNNLTGVEMMLNRGVPVDGHNEFGCTPLMCAANAGHEEMIKLLIRRKSTLNFRGLVCEETALHWAVKHSDLRTVELLVNLGANVNLQDLRGRTALHRAAEFSKKDIADYLLKNNCKASIREESNLRFSDLWKPAEAGRPKCIRHIHTIGSIWGELEPYVKEIFGAGGITVK